MQQYHCDGVYINYYRDFIKTIKFSSRRFLNDQLHYWTSCTMISAQIGLSSDIKFMFIDSVDKMLQLFILVFLLAFSSIFICSKYPTPYNIFSLKKKSSNFFNTRSLKKIGQSIKNEIDPLWSIFCLYFFSDGFGDWSTNGCTTSIQNSSSAISSPIPSSTTSKKVVCQCNHLTNFALLFTLDDLTVAQKMDEGHQIALALISYVGCGISLAAICVTLLTLALFR